MRVSFPSTQSFFRKNKKILLWDTCLPTLSIRQSVDESFRLLTTRLLCTASSTVVMTIRELRRVSQQRISRTYRFAPRECDLQAKTTNPYNLMHARPFHDHYMRAMHLNSLRG